MLNSVNHVSNGGESARTCNSANILKVLFGDGLGKI